MPDINSTQNAGGFSLQTQSPGFTTPGYDNPEWGALFDAQAHKKANAAKEEKRRWDIENRRKEDMLQDAQNRQAQQDALAQQQRNAPPATEWTSAPMMRSGFSYTGPSGDVRVKKDSRATEDIGYGMGMRGY